MKARKYQPVTEEFNDEIGDQLVAPDPEDRYDEELERARGKLDADQRKVLALRFYADLQLDEIAELIEIPVGTVKSRLHRAIAALRTSLTEKSLAKKPRE